MKALALAQVLVLGACHHATGPVLLLTPPLQQPPWITVSLTIAGEEADDDKRETCVEEARNAGIQLAPNGARTGTLYFLDHDDYLETATAPRFVFGAMSANATCKIALARLVDLDRVVRTAKADPQAKCEETGRVEGSDTGFLHPGSYDAAVAEAQFKVRLAGGNLFVQDASQQLATRVVVNGRGYRCSP